MARERNKFRTGVTLIELIITIVAAVILLLGITGILASGIKNYKTMYERLTSEVIRNAYEARSIFDAIVRKSSIKRCDLSNPRENAYDQLIVYYYSDPNDPTIENPDRYAAFYRSGTDLIMEQGILPNDFFTTIPPPPPPQLSYTGMVIAHNVSFVEGVPGIFSYDGHSVQMVLTLDNENPPYTPDNKLETLWMTVTSTALRHNI